LRESRWGWASPSVGGLRGRGQAGVVGDGRRGPESGERREAARAASRAADQGESTRCASRFDLAY